MALRVGLQPNDRTHSSVIFEHAGSCTNPFDTIQIKYFEIFGLTNQIHDMNLLKTGLQIKSTKQIFRTQ